MATVIRESTKNEIYLPGWLLEMLNLHDGSIETIEEMVALMGKYQLARDLTTEEINSIVTFLGALYQAGNVGFRR